MAPLPGLSAQDALRRLTERHGLRVGFPPAVLAETRAWEASPGIDDPSLVDLTHLPFVTIDETTSRDLDQAVCVQTRGEALVLWYAIADAAWYVRPGSALFREAMARGASYYLPGRTIPMLPPALSEGLISLNPRVDRRALVFRVELDARGEVQAWELLRARLHSRAKLAWEPVQAFYQGGPCPTDAPGVPESLRALQTLGRRRLALAASRHMVRYRRVELVVGLEDLRFVAVADLRNDIERYNEQVSVLCNTLGARLLRDSGADLVQAVYRVHRPPPHQALTSLQAWIDALVQRQGLPLETWTWVSEREHLADYLARLPRTRIAAAIHRQAVLVNLRSEFQAEPAPHHGVGAEVYARFTAPMREVVGVFVHKEALEALQGAPLPALEGALPDETLREQVIASANRARQLQKTLDREVNRLVLDQLLGEDLARGGVVRRGTVMGITRTKVHVRLDQPPVDLKLYVRHLQQQRGLALRADEAGISLRTSNEEDLVRTGDEVRVSVTGVDEQRDRWVISLI